MLRDPKSGRIVGGTRTKNLICAAGENLLAALLNGETSYASATIPTGASWTAQVYGAVGTGAATPARGDTQLVTEAARVGLALNSRSSGAVTFNFFFTTSQANVTITEVGVFLMASSTANSGQMLNHASISPSVAKTSAVTATLQVQFSLA